MDADLIEGLAEQVHISWMAEKVAQGFADHTYQPISSVVAMMTGAHPDSYSLCRGDGTVTHIKRWSGREPGIAVSDGTLCDIPANRHHPDMLPYADLAENVKEDRREPVRAVLRALDAAGLQIVQATSYATRTQEKAT